MEAGGTSNWLTSLVLRGCCVVEAVATMLVSLVAQTSVQFERMRSSLDASLCLEQTFSQWGLQQGWQLPSISNCVVRSLGDGPLETPRLKRGAIDCVFYDHCAAKVRTSKASVDAATLFFNAVSVQQQRSPSMAAVRQFAGLHCIFRGLGAATAFAGATSTLHASGQCNGGLATTV